MANNVVLKSIDLTEEWEVLSDVPLIADVTLLVSPTTSPVVLGAHMLIRCGSDTAHLARDHAVRWAGIDLSKIEVSSTYPSMRLLVIGNTR